MGGVGSGEGGRGGWYGVVEVGHVGCVLPSQGLILECFGACSPNKTFRKHVILARLKRSALAEHRKIEQCEQRKDDSCKRRTQQ